MDALKNRLRQDKPSVEGAAVERLSSVVVPIGWNSNRHVFEIVLTKRTETVDTHKGQVSFPGGRFDKSDPDIQHTALRELEEEIGMAATDVSILGRLEPVVTLREIVIVPWVGLVTLPYPFQMNDREVASILYLSFEDLMTKGLETVEVSVGSRIVHSIGIRVSGELVWGATAQILNELRDHLSAIPPWHGNPGQ